jgi:hypothetical protein
MLALSGLREGFARGWTYQHTACPERSRRAELPVPKNPAAKPCVSITSKLIEIKALQVPYFGHLRKTGGRGSYRLVHTAYPPLRKPHGTKFNHSRTYGPLSRKSNYSRTYATPRGWGVFPGPTFKHHLKCRRADIGSPLSVVGCRLSAQHASQATPPSSLATGRWPPATGHFLCYPIHRRPSRP